MLTEPTDAVDDKIRHLQSIYDAMLEKVRVLASQPQSDQNDAALGAAIETFEMSARQKILSRVLDPNLAFVLALAGLLGLYIEVTHPGLILPGVIGGISLVLALFAFNLLPVNWTGAASTWNAADAFDSGIAENGGNFAFTCTPAIDET